MTPQRAALSFDVPVNADLAGLFALHSDPRVWAHMPSGRHTTSERTATLLQASIDGWQKCGLDYWVVHVSGSVAAMGGVRRVDLDDTPTFWNLYYRVAPQMHRQGVGAQIARRGVAAAREHSPDLPVVACMRLTNPGSIAVAATAGLTEVWRGPDGDDPDIIALRYADREVSPDLLARWP